METGGFKGRSRELPRDELYAWIDDRLGVPPARIVNQYGMTELGSQFYDSVLREPRARRGASSRPPWTRVRILDPRERRATCAPGELGRDRGSSTSPTPAACSRSQTADLGRAVGDGFEVLGRDAGRRGARLLDRRRRSCSRTRGA